MWVIRQADVTQIMKELACNLRGLAEMTRPQDS